jgi:hypothetical protein
MGSKSASDYALKLFSTFRILGASGQDFMDPFGFRPAGVFLPLERTPALTRAWPEYRKFSIGDLDALDDVTNPRPKTVHT